MKKLKFKDDPTALERLANAQSALNKFSAKHSAVLSEADHHALNALLTERAAALSQATGLKIHPIVDND